MNRSTGAKLKDQKNTSHVVSSHRTKRLPHTGSRMRVAGLRGDSYFTHFEVVRMMRFAACMPEKAQKNATSECELPVFISVNFLKDE